MDGKNVRFSGDFIGNNFKIDTYGSYIPLRSKLRMEEAQDIFGSQLKARELWKRMTEKYYSTDVEFTNNARGNSPVLGFGVKLFGLRPLRKLKFRERLNLVEQPESETNKRIMVRARKMEQYSRDVLALHESCKSQIKSKADELMHDVEGDQALTGGGFDNNKIGDIHKAALNFIIKSNSEFAYEDSELSKLVVEGCKSLQEFLINKGLRLGSLEPTGLTKTRYEQDTDGMIGFSTLLKGNAPLTKEISLRWLKRYGVDTRPFVGRATTDKNNGVTYPYRVVDGLVHILDNMIVTEKELINFVILLARIQKAGYKRDGSNLISKDGKARVVQPGGDIPGALEAMLFTAFNNELQRLKVPILVSLQDKATRVQILKADIQEANSKGYDFLAADWSQYDATVKGGILATLIQLVVKPFYNARYYDWVDAVTYGLIFKYLICDTSLCGINSDLFALAKSSGASFEEGPFTIFGLVDGLQSGAKFTHVGGSLYGSIVIHYGIPRLLGYEPIFGAQAGDDTLLGIPTERIITSSVEDTYSPIAEAANKFGLDINPSKQIWHQQEGEIVKVFLQEVYHSKTDLWGIGSIFRPLSALPYSERDKGLSVSEQMMAEIARMNQGYDNPFAETAVIFWLEQEQWLGAMVKERGAEEMFQLLVENIGGTPDDIAKKIDVGSFTFGVSKEDLRTGHLPILSVMDNASSKIRISVSESEALKALNVKASQATADILPDGIDETESVITEA